MKCLSIFCDFFIVVVVELIELKFIDFINDFDESDFSIIDGINVR